MGVIVSHPTGNEFSKAVVKGLHQNNILQSYYTTVANLPNSLLHKLGRLHAFSDLNRRAIDISLKRYVHTHEWRELARQAAIKTGFKKLVKHGTGFFSVDAVYKDLDKYVSKKLSSEKNKGAYTMYAYEDGAYYSFKRAKSLNLTCIYDLPIGYWRTMREIFIKEKKINPEWACTMEGLNDSEEKLNKKDKEIELADVMIVASNYTLSTLKKFPGILPKVYVVPYAFPNVINRSFEAFGNKRKLKLLFVGGLSQRKGLSYLFAAADALKNYVTLTIVGRSNKTCNVLNNCLNKHTWISTLPHAEILKLMREHDVLIFPSLFEGFGLVITEAMAQGTPVITTERTAGPDIIRHNENGWIVKAGSIDDLKISIENLLINPQLVKQTGKEAIKTAKERTWKVYETEIAEIIKKSKT